MSSQEPAQPEVAASALQQMNERRQAWLDSKPGGADWGSELRFQEGDIIVFQFCSSGNDGDQFIKLWRSHEFETVTRGGRPSSVHRYCPAQNGDAQECPYCAQGHAAFKERMSMWLAVSDILHTTMPPEKNFPQVPFQGRYYFREEVNGFRIWHTSAWRDSPWTDIYQASQIYKGLHSFTAQLIVTGKELERRFKFYPIPESPHVTPELYERAKVECTPIPQILKEQMATPVQAAPAQAAAAGAQPPVVPWAPPGSAGASEYKPGGPTLEVQPDPNPTQPLKSLF